MSLELIYTSAPRGLKAGSSGFCTVAATAGMSRQVMMKLESLSGYDFLFGLSDAKAEMNPPNFAYSRITIGAESKSVLSRVGFAGADYSGRSNKTAHHMLLSRGDEHPEGPAAMMLALRDSHFKARWEGDPLELAEASFAGLAVVTGGAAKAWERAAGDAGWAGELARSFRRDQRAPAFLICEPGTDVLMLFAESLALLEPQERWQVTFSTFCNAAPAGVTYAWRGAIAGTEAARDVARHPHATVIDLTRSLGAPREDKFTSAARSTTVAPVLTVAAPVREGVLLLDADNSPYGVRDVGPGQGITRRVTAAGGQGVCPHTVKRLKAAVVVLSVLVLALAGLSTWLLLMQKSADAPVQTAQGPQATKTAQTMVHMKSVPPDAEGEATTAGKAAVAATVDTTATVEGGEQAGDAAEAVQVDSTPANEPEPEPELELFQAQEMRDSNVVRIVAKKELRDGVVVFGVPRIIGFVETKGPFAGGTVDTRLEVKGKKFVVRWKQMAPMSKSILSCTVTDKGNLLVVRRESDGTPGPKPERDRAANEFTVQVVCERDGERQVYLCSLALPPKPEKLPIGYNGKDYVKPQGPYPVSYPWPKSLRWQWKGVMGEKTLGLENKWEYAAQDWHLRATFVAEDKDKVLNKGAYVKFETDFLEALKKLRRKVSQESQEERNESNSQDDNYDKLKKFVAAAGENVDGTLQLVDEAGRPVAEFELRIAPKSDKTQNDQ